jgi:hypothetical protein
MVFKGKFALRQKGNEIHSKAGMKAIAGDNTMGLLFFWLNIVR